MTDKHRAKHLGLGIPFALVPVDLDDGRECWSLWHIPCDQPTGNDPGWWEGLRAVNDVHLWWGRLSSEQQSAFSGTDIQAMKDRDCPTALDELVEMSDFRIVNPEDPS